MSKFKHDPKLTQKQNWIMFQEHMNKSVDRIIRKHTTGERLSGDRLR